MTYMATPSFGVNPPVGEEAGWHKAQDGWDYTGDFFAKYSSKTVPRRAVFVQSLTKTNQKGHCYMCGFMLWNRTIHQYIRLSKGISLNKSRQNELIQNALSRNGTDFLFILDVIIV